MTAGAGVPATVGSAAEARCKVIKAATRIAPVCLALRDRLLVIMGMAVPPSGELRRLL
jgi:hypothetical protein